MRPSFSVDRCWLLTSNFFTQAVTAVADVVAAEEAAVVGAAGAVGAADTTTGMAGGTVIAGKTLSSSSDRSSRLLPFGIGAVL